MRKRVCALRCFVCDHEVLLKLSIRDKPYFCCAYCKTQVFFRSLPGTELILKQVYVRELVCQGEEGEDDEVSDAA